MDAGAGFLGRGLQAVGESRPFPAALTVVCLYIQPLNSLHLGNRTAIPWDPNRAREMYRCLVSAGSPSFPVASEDRTVFLGNQA